MFSFPSGVLGCEASPALKGWWNPFCVAPPCCLCSSLVCWNKGTQAENNTASLLCRVSSWNWLLQDVNKIKFSRIQERIRQSCDQEHLCNANWVKEIQEKLSVVLPWRAELVPAGFRFLPTSFFLSFYSNKQIAGSIAKCLLFPWNNKALPALGSAWDQSDNWSMLQLSAKPSPWHFNCRKWKIPFSAASKIQINNFSRREWTTQ